jgi:hypothetical protein
LGSVDGHAEGVEATAVVAGTRKLLEAAALGVAMPRGQISWTTYV